MSGDDSSRPSDRGKTFAELCSTHKGMLFRFLLPFAAVPSERDDMLQEVFKRYLEQPKGTIRNDGAWLIETAKHVCQERWALQRRNSRHIDGDTRCDEVELELVSKLPHPEEVAEAAWAKREITLALDAVQLDQQHRAVLFLIVDGVSEKEVARERGLSVHQVRRYLRNALVNLRDWFGKHGERDSR